MTSAVRMNLTEEEYDKRKNIAFRRIVQTLQDLGIIELTATEEEVKVLLVTMHLESSS
jgi:hypothetical protein